MKIENTKSFLSRFKNTPKSHIYSSECQQHFDRILISDKGMIRLERSGGKDFMFPASSIERVIRCVNGRSKENDVSLAGVVGKLLSNYIDSYRPPQEDYYIALELGGRYQQMVFIEQSYLSNVDRIDKARDVSYEIHEKKYGKFS